MTSEEADAANGKISTTSPIGRALLSKEVGDEVKVQSPGGIKELEILKLTTIHDDSRLSYDVHPRDRDLLRLDHQPHRALAGAFAKFTPTC